MSRSLRSQLVVNVPELEARVYRKAAHILVTAIGRKAPNVVALILHELSGRKPESVAAEFLYFIGRPGAATKKRSLRIDAPRGPRPIDPSRN